MIVGNGLIARAFSSHAASDEVLIFASGVSNSKEIDLMHFVRERELLRTTIESNPTMRCVYFSTSSVLDPLLQQEPYVVHKLACEKMLKESCNDPLILRVSNVVGKSGNPATVFNFFKHKIQNEQHFELWSGACRNFLDVDDLVSITDIVLSNEKTLKSLVLSSPKNYLVSEIVAHISTALNKRAIYTQVEKGTCHTPDMEETLSLYTKHSIGFAPNYLENLINKYL